MFYFHQVDYKRVFDAVLSGNGIEKTKELCNVHTHESLEYLRYTLIVEKEGLNKQQVYGIDAYTDNYLHLFPMTIFVC